MDREIEEGGREGGEGIGKTKERGIISGIGEGEGEEKE